MNSRIRLLLTLDGFRIAAFGLLGPIYAIFVEEIGGDILDAGTAFAIYSITLGVITYFIGRLGDKVKNHVNLLLIGHTIMAIGMFSYLLVKNSSQLFIVQAILGIGAAMSDPIYDSLFSENLDKGRHDSEWANWESLNFILAGITAIVGASVAEFIGFDFFICNNGI